MKKLLSMLLCAILILGTCTTLLACNNDKQDESTTAAGTKNDAQTTTSEATTAGDEQATTDDKTETTDAATGETTEETTGNNGQPQEGDIIIKTAEDFINLNKRVIAQMAAWQNAETAEDEKKVEFLDGITVYFEDDIDMSGYEWIPMDGHFIQNVTFDGKGHTIKNLKIIDPGEDRIPDIERGTDVAYDHGYGIIGNIYGGETTFKNLKFDTAELTANNKHCAILVGGVYPDDDNVGAVVNVENVSMEDITVNGRMPMDGAFTIRTACYIAVLFGNSEAYFKDCSVTTAYLSGFHNLAVFVGYDGTTLMGASNFENCNAFDVTMEFSYCQSSSYTLKKPFCFVSVFYNSTQWTDNIDEVAEAGNTYGNITFKDNISGTTLTPDNFRSWSEDSEDFQAYKNGKGFKDIPENRQ